MLWPVIVAALLGTRIAVGRLLRVDRDDTARTVMFWVMLATGVVLAAALTAQLVTATALDLREWAPGDELSFPWPVTADITVTERG